MWVSLDRSRPPFWYAHIHTHTYILFVDAITCVITQSSVSGGQVFNLEKPRQLDIPFTPFHLSFRFIVKAACVSPTIPRLTFDPLPHFHKSKSIKNLAVATAVTSRKLWFPSLRKIVDTGTHNDVGHTRVRLCIFNCYSCVFIVRWIPVHSYSYWKKR